VQAARVLKGKIKTLQKISMLILQCAGRLSTIRARKKYYKSALVYYFYFSFIMIAFFYMIMYEYSFMKTRKSSFRFGDCLLMPYE